MEPNRSVRKGAIALDEMLNDIEVPSLETPDGTDAFDTLYIGAEKFPFHDTFTLITTGVL